MYSRVLMTITQSSISSEYCRLFCVHIDEYSDTGNHDGQSSSLVQLYSSKLGLDANLYTNWYEDRYRYLTEKSSFLSSAAVWYWSKLLYESKIIELWLPTDLCFCSFKVIRKFLVPGMTSLTLSYIPG